MASVLKTSLKPTRRDNFNLVLNADFLTVIPCDMTSPFGSNQFITIPVEETLPAAQYAAVWSKNYRIKKAASVLVEFAKEYLIL